MEHQGGHGNRRFHEAQFTRRQLVTCAGAGLALLSLVGCASGGSSSASSANSDAASADSTSADTTSTQPPVVNDRSEDGATSASESADQQQDQPVDEPSAPKSEFARMLDAGEVASIRLIGDSITAGWGCDGYGPLTDTVIFQSEDEGFFETAPEVDCWANDFRAYANDRGVGSFVNAGIPGAKMSWLAGDPDAWIGEGADVIFVMLGTNDAVYSTEDEYRSDAEAGLAAVSDACRLMMVLSPPNNERTDSENLYGPDVLDRILTEVCDEHGYQHISLLDSLELYSPDFNDDQLHPSSSGSHKMWERLRAELGL